MQGKSSFATMKIIFYWFFWRFLKAVSDVFQLYNSGCFSWAFIPDISIICLFGVFWPTREFFTHMETSASPLPVKDCKFWLMLGTYGHCWSHTHYVTQQLHCNFATCPRCIEKSSSTWVYTSESISILTRQVIL